MAGRTFSQIVNSPSNLASADHLVGVTAANTDVLFTPLQVGLISQLPGDALTAAGTPSVAAHSMIRKLFAAYNGNLFQVRRTSDNAIQDIGVAADGFADVASLNTFLGVSSGAVVQIYDQTGNNNILPQATNANQGALTLRYTQLARQVPVVTIASGQFYRNRASTTSIPTGSGPITVYMVVSNSGGVVNPVSIGTYGNMEATVANTGTGHMFALICGSSGQPHPGIDFENGTFEPTNPDGSTYNENSDFTVVLGKTQNNAQAVIKAGPASSSTVITAYNGTVAGMGLSAFHMEGGISLGEGGDGTPAPIEWAEGIIAAGFSSDATDQNIQSNLATVFGQYGGLQQYVDHLATNQPVVLGNNLTVDGTVTLTEISSPSNKLEFLMGGNNRLDWNITNNGGWTVGGLAGLFGGYFLAQLAAGGNSPGHSVGLTSDAATGTRIAIFLDGSDNPQLGFGSGSAIDTGITRIAPVSSVPTIAIGNGTSADASGTIKAKTKAGAPTASDVPAGTWALIRDTTNSTTKLYYNNAGTLMTVALT